MLDERYEVDRPEAAASVRRQGLLAAGVGRLDRLAVVEVVVAIHAVDEQHARLGMVVRRAHDLRPQVARGQLAVHPDSIGALERSVLQLISRGLCAVHELDLQVLLDRAHEFVGNPDREVEVAEVPVVLGVDELLDVRMVAAQDSHLRAAARAGGFHGFARAVEHAHVRHRPGRARVGALDLGAFRADRGKS
jgi:hypothetical protein